LPDVFGPRVRYRAIGHGIFHCERCGGDREYRHRSGRTWAHVLGVPVMPLGFTGEHLRCVLCRTCYRVELLAVPTTEQMQLSLLAATMACALAMLQADGAASGTARNRAIDAIRTAGAPQYDDAALVAALTGMPGEYSAGSGLATTLQALEIQLEMPAREWFLARIVHIGLGGGSLGAAEREVIESIARHLGMSAARAQDVISVTEEAAQAG
jgi:tellurite resistance protein